MAASTSTDASAQRVELMRQKLEQYNQEISRAVADMSAVQAQNNQHHNSNNSQPIVPPSIRLSTTTGGGAASGQGYRSYVERNLTDEFTDAARRSQSSVHVDVTTLLSAQSGSRSHPREEVAIDLDEGEDDEGRAPDGEEEEEDEEELEDDEEESESPTPRLPTYTMNDLETGFNRISAVLESVRVLSTINWSPYVPLHHDRVETLQSMRRQLLQKDEELTQRRQMVDQRWGEVRSADTDTRNRMRQLLSECEAAKKYFTAVFERKANLYAKEKQLEQLTAELQRHHAATQAQRATLTSMEARLEHRRRAIRRREEQMRANMASQSAREAEVQEKITRVEALGTKVSSWTRILEQRDADLHSKEERLGAVLRELRRRTEAIMRIEGSRPQ